MRNRQMGTGNDNNNNNGRFMRVLLVPVSVCRFVDL